MLLRWKAFFAVCAAVSIVLVVYVKLTGDISVAKSFTTQNFKKSNSTKRPAIFESKSLLEKFKLQKKRLNDAKPICQSFDELGLNVTKTIRKGCSVPVFKSKNQTDYYARNSSCPLCTSALFKKYYRNHSAFISDGYWAVLTSGNRIQSATFRPPFCSFRRRDLDLDFIRNCFTRRGVRKIVTIGDSNARYTFSGLKAVLAAAGIRRCELVKAEKDSFFTIISYYLPAGTRVPEGYVSVENRGCHSCNARQFRCLYDAQDSTGHSHSTSLVLEHLPLSYIIDNSVRILRPIGGFRPTNYTQEFLLRDYLGQSGQPDVLILVTPFLREARSDPRRHGKIGLKGVIKKLITIVNKYIQKSTQVYWVPSQYVFGGKNESFAVGKCNEDFYESLKEHIGSASNRMHGTLDLLSLSCPLVELSVPGDSAHMQSKWYEVISKHLLELLCN